MPLNGKRREWRIENGLRHLAIFYFLFSPFVVRAWGAAPNLYFAQNAAGTGDGSSCANAKAISFFNAAANWGSGSGQIGLGTTVHLCGTFLGTLDSNILTFFGSGTSENPITLRWEPGSLLTSPACGSGAQSCINTNSQSYLVLDGNGTSPSITFSANGKGQANQVDGMAVYAQPCNGCELKNLTITNLYIQSAPADATGGGTSIRITGSNWSIHDNSFDQAFVHIDDPYQNGDTNLQIYNNTFNHMNWGTHIGNNAPTHLSNVYIHNNTLLDMDNWDAPGNPYHHDGFFVVQNNGSAVISGIYVYDNFAKGAQGTSSTAWFYANTGLNGIYVFNNLFTSSDGNGYDVYIGATSGDQNVSIFNNVLDCNGGSGIRSSGVINLNIQNNTMLNCYSYLLVDNPVNPTLDYNAYDASGSATGHAFKWNNLSGATWTSFKADNAGLDMHSIAPASLALSASYQPQTGSPLIGSGTNLTSSGVSLLLQDKAGTARSASGTWDIGAYQFSAGGNSPCDLNGTGGSPNVADVQVCVNQALGVASCTNGDVNQDSLCNVADVQRVVNGALGGTCP